MKFYLCCTDELKYEFNKLVYNADEIAQKLFQAGYQLHRSEYDDNCRWWFEIDSVTLLLAICRIIDCECIINTWRDKHWE